MNNFQFYAPTKVVFGKETENQVGSLVKKSDGKKVLIHYGSNSAVKSGLVDRISSSLKEADINFVTLGGVVPNPRLSKVYEGIELCKKEGVDFILAVGGGSVIDSAKAIAYGIGNPDIDVWDLFTGKAKAKTCLPLGAVLTIAAAGSEMSNSCVITKEEGWLKRAYNNNLSRCQFSVSNPELTYTLPAYQTASGCADILMHTLERYLIKDETMELTDGISEALMQTVICNARILMEDPENYNARAEVMWASSLSHNDLTQCGGGAGDWSCHQLEHELGGMFDIAHGAGLAAIWGSWARYVYEECPERFAQLATNVFNISCDGNDYKKTALAGICAMEDFFRSIQMPTSVKDLDIQLTDAQIEELAFKCSFEKKRKIGSLKRLTADDMANIYKAAR